MKYLATHKKSGNTVELTAAEKEAYEAHPATRGLYKFAEIKEPKAVTSLDEDQPSRKRRKPK